jgi:hypothetical protein
LFGVRSIQVLHLFSMMRVWHSQKLSSFKLF